MILFPQNYNTVMRSGQRNQGIKGLSFQASRRILVFLLGAALSGTAAAAEIDSDTTTPVTTSTANSGAPGDIVVTEDGEIDVTGSAGISVITADTDNSVTMDGNLIAEDTDNVVGIHVTTGRTLNISQDGTLQLIEDYDREDEDDDDDDDGPLAIGTGRTGILVDDGSALQGNIEIGDSGYIQVEGNDSAGIVVRSQLDGSLINAGSILVTGDNAVGVNLSHGITGDVTLTGTISATGQNAAALQATGDIGGAFSLDGTISSTGFTSTGQTNYIAPTNIDEDTEAVEDRLDPDDLYDNDFAFRLTGSVANGILINGAVDTYTSEEDEDDETKDTVDDFDENRGTGRIYSYGSGIALDIEAVDSDIVLGPVVETVRDTLDDDEDDDTDEVLAIFDYDQGFINRGTILANGINIGFEATALRIHGAEDGSASVTIDGGILNAGTIQATAYEADAVAVDLGPYVNIGTLENSGTITASTYTLTNESATGLNIGAGTNLETLINSGSIIAKSNGYGGVATAVLGNSNTLALIENTGTISAALVSDGREDLGTGKAVAIDISTQTIGTTLIQYQRTPVEDTNGDDEIDDEDVTSPYTIGDVLFGSGDDTFRILDGYVSGDTDFGAGSSVFELTDALYSGDITFGDTVDATISNSTLMGDLHFGTSGGTLSISGGSEVEGNFFSTGSSLSLLIADSDLVFSEDTALALSDLSVSGSTSLAFEIDPKNLRSDPFITVGGTTRISDNLSVKPVLTSVVAEDFVVTLISSGTLDFAGDYSTVATDIPWLYSMSLEIPESDPGLLNLDFHLKSAEELNLDTNQSNAYAAVLQVATSDDDIGAAVQELTTEKGFLQAYNLLLPQRTDAATRYLESQSSAAFGSLSDHLALNRSTSESGNGAWIQENFSNVEVSATSDSPGYNGRGLGLSVGYDWSLFGLDAIGLVGTMSDGRFEEKTGGLNPVSMKSLGAGAYAADHFGPVNLQVAALYSDIGHSSFRRVIISDYLSDVSGEWDGTSLSASVQASAVLGSGPFQMTPRAGIDYFSLDQDAYKETASNGLNLAVSDSHTEKTTASAGMAFSWTWRSKAPPNQTGPALAQLAPYKSVEPMVRAALDIGYRSTLTSTPYEVDAHFVGYDEIFTLRSSETFGDAATVGLSLLGGSEYLKLRLGVGGEFSDEATVATASASIKLRF